MITIWRFKSAPPELRSLYAGTGEPEWVMQVPLSLAKDLREEFVTAWQVYSHGGTLIYFGGATSMGFLISGPELNQDDSRKTERLGGAAPKD
jgi:hypothetical protein